jgi:hypothetical protein
MLSGHLNSKLFVCFGGDTFAGCNYMCLVAMLIFDKLFTSDLYHFIYRCNFMKDMGVTPCSLEGNGLSAFDSYHSLSLIVYLLLAFIWNNFG